jgi:hypothetical protein
MLSNEFFGLFNVESYETCIEHTITIMNYCAETDPQAKRLLYILTEFRAVVAEKGLSTSGNPVNTGPRILSTPSSSFDPMAHLTGVYDNTSRSNSTYGVRALGDPQQLTNSSRHNSLASMAVPALSDVSSLQSSVLGSTADNNGALQLGGMTPSPHSNSVSMVSQNVDYYRSLPTPGPANSMEPAEQLGDSSVIDFDSFWQWPLDGMSGTGGARMGSGTTGMSVLPSASTGFGNSAMGAFPATFSLNTPTHPSATGMRLNGNIPMYPPSNFV